MCWSHINHKRVKHMTTTVATKGQTHDHNSRGKVHSWVHITTWLWKKHREHHQCIEKTKYVKKNGIPRYCVHGKKSQIRLKCFKKRIYTMSLLKSLLDILAICALQYHSAFTDGWFMQVASFFPPKSKTLHWLTSVHQTVEMYLYLSREIGTWKTHVRVLNRPHQLQFTCIINLCLQYYSQPVLQAVSLS